MHLLFLSKIYKLWRCVGMDSQKQWWWGIVNISGNTFCSDIYATIFVLSGQRNISALIWVVICYSTEAITKVTTRYVHPIPSFFQPSIPTPCGTLQRLPQNTKNILTYSLLTLDFLFWTPFDFPKHKIFISVWWQLGPIRGAFVWEKAIFPEKHSF